MRPRTLARLTTPHRRSPRIRRKDQRSAVNGHHHHPLVPQAMQGAPCPRCFAGATGDALHLKCSLQIAKTTTVRTTATWVSVSGFVPSPTWNGAGRHSSCYVASPPSRFSHGYSARGGASPRTVARCHYCSTPENHHHLHHLHHHCHHCHQCHHCHHHCHQLRHRPPLWGCPRRHCFCREFGRPPFRLPSRLPV